MIPVTIERLSVNEARLVSVTRLDDVDDSAGMRPSRPGRSKRALPTAFSRIDDALAAVLFAHRVAVQLP